MYALNRYMGADFKKKEELEMTVREVVMLAAEELRIAQEVSDYFDRGSIEGKEKAELLLTCFNLVEDELALDYLPLETEEKLTSNHGQIYFDQLGYAPVRILKVCAYQPQLLRHVIHLPGKRLYASAQTNGNGGGGIVCGFQQQGV